MDEKTKLYVFAKKEVFLIFVFMILISLTSFLLGVKIGVSNSYEQSGFTQEDKRNIEILSPDEERVGDLEQNKEEATAKELKDKTDAALRKKIESEFLKENKKFNEPEMPTTSEAVAPSQEQVIEAAPSVEPVAMPEAKSDSFSGKHTIQVGAFPSVDEAEAFARGFKARGYTPIINQVEDGNRGTLYKVSLGVFDNISELKDYFMKHKSLFESSDYFFTKFE